MFKVLIFAAVTIAVVFAGDNPDPEYDAAMKTCKPKFPKVTDDMIAGMCTPGYTPTMDDEKCFMLCIGESTGKSDSKGVIIKDAVLKAPPPKMNVDKLKGAIDGCMALSGTNACDTAFVQWSCLVKNTKAG